MTDAERIIVSDLEAAADMLADLHVEAVRVARGVTPSAPLGHTIAAGLRTAHRILERSRKRLEER